MRREDVREYDVGSSGPRQGEERVFDDWWDQCGITHTPASTEDSRLRAPRPDELAVGSFVCARWKCPGTQNKRYPARVTRCNLDGTVDLVFVTQKEANATSNIWPDANERQCRVHPSTLLILRTSEVPTPVEDSWRLRVGDSVRVVTEEVHNGQDSGGDEVATIARCHADSSYSVKLGSGTVLRVGRSRLHKVERREATSDEPNLDSNLSPNSNWHKALLTRVRDVLRRFCAGVPGGTRGALLSLVSNESGDRVVEARALKKVLASSGLDLSEEEMSFIMQHVHAPLQSPAPANDKIDVRALTFFVQGEDGTEDDEAATIGEYLTSRAATVLRRELLRCIQREGGPPNARECFESVDANHDGRIDVDEFDRLLRTLGARLPQRTKTSLFRLLDQDADGFIDRQEFIAFVRLGFTSLSLCDKEGNHVRAMPLSAVADEFRRLRRGERGSLVHELDKDGDGQVSATELEAALVAAGWGDVVEGTAQTQDVVDALDVDGDGQLDPEEIDSFLRRHGASLEEEVAVLRKFRAALAKWCDSPLALTELSSLSSSRGSSSRSREDALRDLQELNLGLQRREVEIVTACFVESPSASSVPHFVRSVWEWYRRALSERWKPLGTARELCAVIQAFDPLSPRQLEKLRALTRRARNQTKAEWTSLFVPALRDAGLAPAAVDKIWTSLSRTTKRLHALLEVVKSDPVATCLVRTTRGRQHAQLSKTIEQGSLVDVLLDRRQASGRSGTVTQVRANGRFDVQLDSTSRGEDDLLVGLRRRDIRPKQEALKKKKSVGDATVTPPLSVCSNPPSRTACMTPHGGSGVLCPEAFGPQHRSRRNPTATTLRRAHESTLVIE